MTVITVLYNIIHLRLHLPFSTKGLSEYWAMIRVNMKNTILRRDTDLIAPPPLLNTDSHRTEVHVYWLNRSSTQQLSRPGSAAVRRRFICFLFCNSENTPDEYRVCGLIFALAAQKPFTILQNYCRMKLIERLKYSGVQRS